jgi:hypothetical protein
VQLTGEEARIATKTVRVIILMPKNAPDTSHPIVRSLGDVEPFDLFLTYPKVKVDYRSCSSPYFDGGTSL